MGWQKKKKEDKTLQEATQDFLQVVSEDCIYVCNLCQQTWFRDQEIAVTQFQSIQYQDLLIECCTGYKSGENLEWGLWYMQTESKLSITNKMGFPTKPKELELLSIRRGIKSTHHTFYDNSLITSRRSKVNMMKYMACTSRVRHNNK